MKKTLCFAAMVAATLMTPALAGGPVFVPNDPVVTPPADVSGDWTGPYVGLFAGRVQSGETTTSYSEQCFKFNDILGERFSDDPVDCATYVPPDGYSLERVQVPGETTSTEASSEEIGIRLGYRRDLGRIVLGVEGNASKNWKSLEAQAGFDLNKVLAYGFVGGADFANTSATIYGVGADLKVGKHVLLGVKHTTGDFNGETINLTTASVAWQF